MDQALLDVQGLETRFWTREGAVHAVNGISLRLENGETVGIVGESGCGKSVSVLSVMRLIPQPSRQNRRRRQVLFQGRDLLKRRSTTKKSATCAARRSAWSSRTR